MAMISVVYGRCEKFSKTVSQHFLNKHEGVRLRPAECGRTCGTCLQHRSSVIVLDCESRAQSEDPSVAHNRIAQAILGPRKGMA